MLGTWVVGGARVVVVVTGAGAWIRQQTSELTKQSWNSDKLQRVRIIEKTKELNASIKYADDEPGYK